MHGPTVGFYRVAISCERGTSEAIWNTMTQSKGQMLALACATFQMKVFQIIQVVPAPLLTFQMPVRPRFCLSLFRHLNLNMRKGVPRS